jgi:uncharacterized protein DUF4149
VHFLAHAEPISRGQRSRALAREVPALNRTGSTALRSALWLVLGGWVGSWTFFALVIARLAFRVLPSPDVAGLLIAPVLRELHGYGIFAGIALAALALALGRGRLLVALPLVLSLACLATQFGVTPRMEGLHDLAFGAAGNLEAAARYRQLHGVSMSIFTSVLIGAIALVVLHVRRETPQTGDSP